MPAKTNFNIGEGVVSADFNELQALLQKQLVDEVVMAMAGASLQGDTLQVNDEDDILRPYGWGGAMLRTSASNINVNGGLWLYRQQGAVNANGPAAKLAFAPAITSLTVTGYAGLGANMRRDIIQMRIVENNSAPVNRHFKDAVTGALSSQSLVKRISTTVEFSLKQGAVSAFPGTEPAPDAGWTKIGSVLVRSTGVDNQDETYDWRVPMGDSTIYSMAHEMQSKAGAGEWQIDADANGWHRAATVAAGYQLNAFCNGAFPSYRDHSALQSSFSSAKRIMAISLRANLVIAPPNAADVQILRHGRYSIGTIGSASGTWNGALGGRISASNTDHFVYGPAAYSNDPPLWTNGHHNPLASTGESVRVSMAFEPVSVGDKVFGVQWDLAG